MFSNRYLVNFPYNQQRARITKTNFDDLCRRTYVQNTHVSKSLDNLFRDPRTNDPTYCSNTNRKTF